MSSCQLEQICARRALLGEWVIGEGGRDGDQGHVPGEGGTVDSTLYVDGETFCNWLVSGKFLYGTSVAKWFARVEAVEDGVQDEAVKQGYDETIEDLFRCIMMDLKRVAEVAKYGVRRYPSVKGGKVFVPKMVEWLEKKIGVGLGVQGGQYEGYMNFVLELVLHELEVAGIQNAMARFET